MKVLITGGSGGIGSALVQGLCARGDEVVFTYNFHKDAAEKLAEETGATAFHYDQKDKTPSIAALIEGGAFGGLVHIAAPKPLRKKFVHFSADSFSSYVDDSLRPVFALSQAFAQAALAHKRPGSIVTVLTSYTLGMPPSGLSEYVTAKHALLGLVRAMAAELTPHGIRVNAVSPGVTKTDYISDLPQRLIEMEEEDHPMKRIAKPEEVASVIAFLLSEEASYISGANIPVTGGDAC